MDALTSISRWRHCSNSTLVVLRTRAPQLRQGESPPPKEGRPRSTTRREAQPSQVRSTHRPRMKANPKREQKSPTSTERKKANLDVFFLWHNKTIRTTAVINETCRFFKRFCKKRDNTKRVLDIGFATHGKHGCWNVDFERRRPLALEIAWSWFRPGRRGGPRCQTSPNGQWVPHQSEVSCTHTSQTQTRTAFKQPCRRHPPAPHAASCPTPRLAESG